MVALGDAEEFGSRLKALRREMVESGFRGFQIASWHARTRIEFIREGGSWREIKWMEECLRRVIPEIKSYLADHLGNGGVRADDNFLRGMKIAFHVAGFSDEDFDRAINLAVDEYFAPQREKNLEKRFS